MSTGDAMSMTVLLSIVILGGFWTLCGCLDNNTEKIISELRKPKGGSKP